MEGMEGVVRGVNVHTLGNVTCCLTNTDIPLAEAKVLAVGHDGASKCFRKNMFFERLNAMRLKAQANLETKMRRHKKRPRGMPWEVFLPGLAQSGPHYTFDTDKFCRKKGCDVSTQLAKEISEALGTPALMELVTATVTAHRSKNPPPKAKKARRPKRGLASGRA